MNEDNRPEVLQPFGNAGMELERDRNMIDVAMSRAAQEVQAAMVIARKFPRNETRAVDKIMTACKRIRLAEDACYVFPRGNESVSGPSVYLAKAIAAAWGNIEHGIIELEQRHGESTVMAYAWDLETNTRASKVFTVRHWRDTKKGGHALTDARDIYEIAANNGARRLRACLLDIIPSDVVDMAVAECDKTLKGKNSEPLIDRIRAMIPEFGKLGVTQAMIENRAKTKCDDLTEHQFLELKKVYKTIRDNMASADSFFGGSDAVDQVKRPNVGGGAVPKKAPEEQKPADKAQEPAKEEKKPAAAQDGPAKEASRPALVADPSKKTIEEIIRFCQHDNVTQLQVLKWAQKMKMARNDQTDLNQLADTKLLSFLKNWAGIVAEIKKQPVE